MLLKIPIKAGDPLIMDVTVTNTGKRDGDVEVRLNERDLSMVR